MSIDPPQDDRPRAAARLDEADGATTATDRPGESYEGTPTDEERAEHEWQTQRSLQACIDAVIERREGRTVAEITAALEEALAADGHAAQPHEWIRAVSQEMAGGRRYVVGTKVPRVSGRDRGAPEAAADQQEPTDGPA